MTDEVKYWQSSLPDLRQILLKLFATFRCQGRVLPAALDLLIWSTQAYLDSPVAYSTHEDDEMTMDLRGAFKLRADVVSRMFSEGGYW